MLMFITDDSREMIDVRQGHQTDVFNKSEKGKYKVCCCMHVYICVNGVASPLLQYAVCKR